MKKFRNILSGCIMTALFCCFGIANVHAQGQGGGGAGLWQANGPSIVYTNRFVGFGLNDPTERVEILGGFLLHGSAFVDSFLTALEVNAGSVTTISLLVTGNSQLTGLLNVGSNLLIDGTSSLVTSSAGFIGFGNNKLTTTGNISADTISGNVLNSNSVLTSDITTGNITANSVDAGNLAVSGN
ncbi:MAG: hypothetical protein ABII90_07750 [Bacteroidota bacterium]